MIEARITISRRELSFVTLTLRLLVGLMLTIMALNRFYQVGPISKWSEATIQTFANTYLPQALITPVAYFLPYAELLLGITIIAGIFTRPALLLTSLLFVGLTCGHAVLRDYVLASGNILYVVATLTCFMMARWNKYSLDNYFGLIDFEERVLTGEPSTDMPVEEEERRVANIR